MANEVTFHFIEKHSPLCWRVDADGECLGFIQSKPPYDHKTKNAGQPVLFRPVVGCPFLSPSHLQSIAAKLDELNKEQTNGK